MAVRAWSDIGEPGCRCVVSCCQGVSLALGQTACEAGRPLTACIPHAGHASGKQQLSGGASPARGLLFVCHSITQSYKHTDRWSPTPGLCARLVDRFCHTVKGLEMNSGLAHRAAAAFDCRVPLFWA